MQEEKTLTLTDLAEFTESTLLPAVERIVDDKIDKKFDEKIGKYNHEIKGYIDDKLADTTSDLRGEIKNVKTELQEEIKGVKKDVEGVKKDVEGVKKDVEGVKKELKQTKADIISTIKGEKERDESFKIKLIEIIKENKLAKEEEIELLETLI